MVTIKELVDLITGRNLVQLQVFPTVEAYLEFARQFHKENK